MEEISAQSQHTTMDKAANVVLDIETLAQPPEKCSGSPQLTRSFSQKGSIHTDKWNNHEQETDDAAKKLVVKVARSQYDQFRLPSFSKKTTGTMPRTSSPMLQEAFTSRGSSPMLQETFTSRTSSPMLQEPFTSRTSSPMLLEPSEGKVKRFQRLMTVNPRKVLLIFATMSSVGTMILIYFTLAINGKAGA